MKKILVVGQTPPPYGGQAIMIQYLLDGTYDDIEMYHVRMCFSKGFEERGKFSFYKIYHIFEIILKIWKYRFRNGTKMLYYPVSSAPKVALLRDVIILAFTRFLFDKIIYHFHAAGVSEELPKYPSLLRKICFHVLSKPDLGITSSEFNPKDSQYLKAKMTRIIPLGIPDENPNEARTEIGRKDKLNILFVGLLNGTKGEGYVVDALYLLKQKGIAMDLFLAGKFESESYKEEFYKKAKDYGIEGNIHYMGIVKGQQKKDLFLQCDIFCFPSFFSSESFGIVLLEAMMYQMPLIASKWRGVQSVVEKDRNGFLVDIKNAEQIAKALEYFDANRDSIERMGKESRILFTEKYEISKYLIEMEKAMNNLN